MMLLGARSPVKTTPVTWTFDMAWGTQGNGNGQFQSGSSVCVKDDGNVLVADDLRNDYQEFDPDGVFIRKSPGSGNGLLQDPFDIVVSPLNGDIFAVGNSGTRVLQYQDDGTWIRTIGTTGSGDGQFTNIFITAVDNSGRLYVHDQDREDIQRFTSAGVFESVWKTNCYWVVHSTYDDLIWTYTPVSGGTRKSFDTAGNLVTDFGAGVIPSSFSNGADYEGFAGFTADLHFYVLNRGNLSVTGTYGSGPGSGDGEFATNDPYDAWPSPDGQYLYVCDHNNHRMQRWARS